MIVPSGASIFPQKRVFTRVPFQGKMGLFPMMIKEARMATPAILQGKKAIVYSAPG